MRRAANIQAIAGFALKVPRTPADFAKLDCWAWAGYSDEKIFNRMRGDWRSEVTTLAGKLHCARCLQRINPIFCIECGQPEEEL